MRFAPYHRLEGRPHVVVDGSPTEGTVLDVTHWPGYPPPPELRADLSAQSAFLLLERPDLVPAGVDVVSNNHFDQDGLVSIFALTAPEEATARRPFLQDVAAAGDFATYRYRDAARGSRPIPAAKCPARWHVPEVRYQGCRHRWPGPPRCRALTRLLALERSAHGLWLARNSPTSVMRRPRLGPQSTDSA